MTLWTKISVGGRGRFVFYIDSHIVVLGPAAQAVSRSLLEMQSQVKSRTC